LAKAFPTVFQDEIFPLKAKELSNMAYMVVTADVTVQEGGERSLLTKILLYCKKYVAIRDEQRDEAAVQLF
jgi:hypothetical protein